MKAHKFNHPNYREFVVKRKARKTHTCDECRKIIKVNDEYYADTFGGEHNPRRAGGHQYYTHKVCSECWKGKNLQANNNRVYKLPFYQVPEEII